jgi:hypothetical protein
MSRSTAAQTPGTKGSLAGAVGCLLVALLLVAALCSWLFIGIHDGLWQVYLLKSRGQPAVAGVTSSTSESRWAGGRRNPNIQVHLHAVKFDGHSGKVRLPQETPVGTEIRVLYLPEAPEVVTAGERDNSLLTLMQGRALESTAWDSLMFSLSCVPLLVLFVAIAALDALARGCRKLYSVFHRTK